MSAATATAGHRQRSEVRSWPFAFVVGCERSGTTLARSMLNAHPRITIPGESYFVRDLVRRQRRYRLGDEFDWRKMADDLFRHEWFVRWNLAERSVRQRLAEEAPSDLRSAISVIYDVYRTENGADLVADKTPAYAIYIDKLAGLFPEARFVHVIRDGRDAALSLLDRPHEPPNTMGQAALFWRRRVEVARSAGLAVRDRYHEIIYEDLVADPSRVLENVARFLGVEFDQRMLAYTRTADEVLRTMNRPQDHQGLRQPPRQGMRDWKTQMSSRDHALFDALAGETLKEFNYSRFAPTQGILGRAVTMARAAEARIRFDTALAAKKARGAAARVLGLVIWQPVTIGRGLGRR